MPNAIPDISELFGYRIFFWSDEGKPLEPVHVHINKGKPSVNSTKYWIRKDGSLMQANNNSHIPDKDLKRIEGFIEMYAFDIINRWEQYFGEEAVYR